MAQIKITHAVGSPGHLKWLPRVGPETTYLMETLKLQPEVRRSVTDSAASILAQGLDPEEPKGNATGLVVGYVQSGKTVSFTTVTALARDNGFRIVVVIAGTTVPLLGQSRSRLEKDLAVHRTDSRSPWFSMPEPTIDAKSDVAIRDLLEQWSDDDARASSKRTLLITVMKHHLHLEKLVAVLKNVDLEGVPVLIIDDEGDQAGLNARVRKSGVSRTYERLLQLRSAIPNHSYLQYTATPQALLLINIMDWLSADFSEVLIPGDGYVGGKDIFVENSPYVALIPNADLPGNVDPLSGPPESLLSAIRVFLLGCAAHTLSDKGDRRSMMIHPSSLRLPHQQYFNWINNYCEQLKVILVRPENDAVREAVLAEFSAEYSNLQLTVPDLPEFERLAKSLKSVLRESKVLEFNAKGGKTPQIRWDQHMYWILVGGLALDRGFTIEGLTVSYMPRGIGVGNADNVQQRARFFGYKRRYLGYCRIFLEMETCSAFQEYVESEEDIRKRLFDFRGKSLTEWRRQFVQTRLLKPTRREVIDIDYQQFTVGDDWVYPERGYEKHDYVKDNRELFSNFLNDVHFSESDFLDNRGEASARNIVSRSIKLNAAIELIASYRANHADDSAQLIAVVSLLQERLKARPEEDATVVYVGSGKPRYRSLATDGTINQVFQGAQYRGSGSGKVQVYLAEREMRDAGRVTLHLSILNLGGTEKEPVFLNVPHIAVYLEDSKSFVSQKQGI